MCRIAVIDDNEAWCFIVADFFCQQGFEVSTFSNSYEFLEAAEQFDLALVDFSIPPRRYQKNTDGPDLIDTIKRTVATPPLLILISAYFTEEILNDAEALCPQADAYLSKSLGLQGILQQVKMLLSTRTDLEQSSSLPAGHRRQ